MRQQWPDLVNRQRCLDIVAGDLLRDVQWSSLMPQVIVDPHVGSPVRARTRCRAGLAIIRVHPRVLDEPVEVLRGTLAHELAHVQQEGKVHGWLPTLASSMLMLAAAVCGYLVLIARGSRATDLGAALALLAIAYLCFRAAFAPQRRSETDADRRSVALVGRAAVVATLGHLHGETPRLLRAAAAAGMGTHPSPSQRLRHVTSAADPRHQLHGDAIR